MRREHTTSFLWLGLLMAGICASSLGAAENLLPVDEILRKLVKRAQSPRSPEAEGYYLCTKHTVTEDMDSSGKVTERKVKVDENRSSPGGPADANKWSNKNGFRLDEELLQRYVFTLDKRENLNGRPTFILSFVPKDPPPAVRQFQDRLLNCVVGTVWVDENDYELAKASLSLRESVSFGILGAVHFFNFSFERARVDDGSWLTRWTDTYVKARKFVIPFQTRKRVDWTDFRKLVAERQVP
ncbi:MAG: hypothetical protein U1G07_15250 [Verrucomicrobiota bacterium]